MDPHSFKYENRGPLLGIYPQYQVQQIYEIYWCLFIGFLLAQEWKCLGSHISFHACTVQYVTQSQHMSQQLNNNIFWECISQFPWYVLSSGNIWLNNLVGQSEIRSHRPIYTRGLGLKAVFLRNFKKNKKCKQIKTYLSSYLRSVVY